MSKFTKPRETRWCLQNTLKHVKLQSIANCKHNMGLRSWDSFPQGSMRTVGFSMGGLFHLHDTLFKRYNCWDSLLSPSIHPSIHPSILSFHPIHPSIHPSIWTGGVLHRAVWSPHADERAWKARLLDKVFSLQDDADKLFGPLVQMIGGCVLQARSCGHSLQSLWESRRWEPLQRLGSATILSYLV